MTNSHLVNSKALPVRKEPIKLSFPTNALVNHLVRRRNFHKFQRTGGGERNRTDDLLLAKQALSQLSYTPVSGAPRRKRRKLTSVAKWWAWVDLNYRPHAYQACALTKLSYRPILVVTN